MRSTITAFVLGLTALPAWGNVPLQRCHVVIICDSHCGPTSQLSTCARTGGRLMYELVNHKLPAGRRTISLIDGRRASPQFILSTLQRLAVRPNESLFVYSISHGSYVQGHGHIFNYSGGNLPRSRLLQAMQAKGAALTILYTECCSNYERGFHSVPKPAADLARPHARDGNLLTDLLLRERGLVDITAARPGQVASARLDCGGNLTGALFLMCTRMDKARFDRDRDGRVTWREAWPTMYQLVGRLYRDAPVPPQTTQQPVCYALGGGKSRPSRVTRRGDDSN